MNLFGVFVLALFGFFSALAHADVASKEIEALPPAEALGPANEFTFEAKLVGSAIVYDGKDPEASQDAALASLNERFPENWNEEFAAEVAEQIGARVAVESVTVERELDDIILIDDRGIALAHIAESLAKVKVKLVGNQRIYRLRHDGLLLGSSGVVVGNPNALVDHIAKTYEHYNKNAKAWRDKVIEQYAESSTKTLVYVENASNYPRLSASTRVEANYNIPPKPRIQLPFYTFRVLDAYEHPYYVRNWVFNLQRWESYIWLVDKE